MSINLIADNALCKHINVRSQGNKKADEPTIAVDIDLEAIFDHNVLKHLLGCTEAPLFWTDQGAVKLPGIGTMPSKARLKEAQLSFGDVTVPKGKATKFRITLQSNKQVLVTCQFQCVPDDDQLIGIKNSIMQRAKLTISAGEQKDIFADTKE